VALRELHVTVAELEATLVSMQTKASYVLAGVGFLGLLGTSDYGNTIFTGAWRWTGPVFVTTIVGSGALLALAYVRFRSGQLELSRIGAADGFTPSSEAPARLCRPGLRMGLYLGGLLGLILSGVVLVLAVWSSSYR
jgi:hypothetical protein